MLAQKETLYTNYANVSDMCGRKISAIEQLKKVLKIHNNFGMALGNLGRMYQQYGMLDYNQDRQELFHYFSYHYLNKACESNDPNTHDDAKACFKRTMELYSRVCFKYCVNPLNGVE